MKQFFNTFNASCIVFEDSMWYCRNIFGNYTLPNLAQDTTVRLNDILARLTCLYSQLDMLFASVLQ